MLKVLEPSKKEQLLVYNLEFKYAWGNNGVPLSVAEDKDVEFAKLKNIMTIILSKFSNDLEVEDIFSLCKVKELENSKYSLQLPTKDNGDKVTLTVKPTDYKDDYFNKMYNRMTVKTSDKTKVIVKFDNKRNTLRVLVSDVCTYEEGDDAMFDIFETLKEAYDIHIIPKLKKGIEYYLVSDISLNDKDYEYEVNRFNSYFKEELKLKVKAKMQMDTESGKVVVFKVEPTTSAAVKSILAPDRGRVITHILPTE